MDNEAKKYHEVFSQIPYPPDGSVFQLLKVEKISIPHSYMITARHVAYASDHHSGMLDNYAIEHSRAPCGWKNCNLKYSEHETQVTLFIKVPQNRDLNAVDGLHAYLLSIKDKATELGIQGFAFPTK